jgi:hypothetical protein
MKVKKYFRKAVAIIAIAGLLASVNIMNASAVSKVSTGSYYMGGYELYGSLTEYPNHAEGFTYCEKKDAGKSARTIYAYYNKSGDFETVSKGSSGYTYNNDTSLSVVTANASDFYLFAGAVTYSKVIYPNATYYSWQSDGTDNELRMGCYKR